MATGNTLLVFKAFENEPPTTNPATPDLRNGHPCLDFDDTTAEGAVFSGVLPRHYAGSGITVYAHWAATSAVSGTGGWTIEIERIGDGQQDIDSDGFASAQTIVAATVPGTSGLIDIVNVAISNGANMDSLAVGESFRLRIKRDVANDTAVGDLELYKIEIKET